MGACATKAQENPELRYKDGSQPTPLKGFSPQPDSVTDKDRNVADPADVVITPGPGPGPGAGGGAGSAELLPPVNALIKQVSSRRAQHEEAGNGGGGARSSSGAGNGSGGDSGGAAGNALLTSVDVPPAFTSSHPAAPLHSEAVHHVIVTENEGETVSCGTDKTIVTYNWRTHSAGEKYSNHSKAVQRVVYSPRHRALFSASRDFTIRQWRGGAFKEVQAFRGHTLAVTGLLLHVSPSGASTLVSGARDYSLRTWSVETGQQTAMRTLQRNVVTNLRWMAPRELGAAGSSFVGGSFVAAQAGPAAAALGSAAGQEEGDDPELAKALSLSRQEAAAASAAHPPGGLSPVAGGGLDVHCLLQCAEDGGAGVRMWDVRSMEVAATFGGGAGVGGLVTTDAMADPDDCNLIVSVTAAHGPEQSQQPQQETGGAPAAGRATGAELRLWDRRVVSSNAALGDLHSAAACPVFSVRAHDDSINSLAFLPPQRSRSAAGPRGIYVATASKDRSMKLWDLSAAQSADGLSAAESPLRCFAALTFRERRFATELTSLAVQPQRASEGLLRAWGALQPSQEQYVLYAAGANGALSCWLWNPQLMRIALAGHTAPAHTRQQQ